MTSGDQQKPPFVPMNLEQVAAFGVVRAAPPKRLWPWVLALLVLVTFLVVLVNSLDSGGGTPTRSFSTPRQALSYLCSHYLAAEHAFTNGQGKDPAGFQQRLAELPFPHVYSRSLSRFLDDEHEIASQLATESVIGGPSTTDMHQLCGP